MGANPLLFIVVILGGFMLLTMRSNKKRQQQAQEMRNRLEPGAGVRTIGGMYALVKDVTDEAVELEVAPGVYALYTKQAIAQVLDPVEYNRIVHGDEPETDEAEGSEDDEATAVVVDSDKTTVEDTPVAFEKTADEAEKTEATVGGDKDASAK
ncbi:preprotein translocase subunit YajC [Streptacidiphilus rugosus]|uniref:preprotein translocase subunit YajC n=1 Tax=Streptacidiphilus rugosus TaxID=405783 RepID=UPI000A8A9981|nr:preprotein translocase subunit YajC [Streptacidiphilus rugosus]